MLNEKKNSKWKIVIIFVIPLIFIIMINITNAIWYDPFNWFNSQDEITLEPAKPSRNTYIINQAKDISVDCYNDKGVTYIEDGQGRILSFTGISNGYCKSIPDGQEIFFEKTINTPVISKDSIAPIVIVSANTKDAFDYLDWSVVEKEYSKPIYDEKEEPEIIGYDVKPQAWDYSINKINDYTQEISFTLKKDYTLKLGDTFIIDPTYTISNISLDADLDDVTCEGGGYFCHLTTNLTEGLVLYMPFDVENNTDTVYDWSITNGSHDGTAKNMAGNSISGWQENGGINSSGAYAFDGSNDYIDNIDITMTSNSTISFWAIVNKLNVDDMIITKEDDDDTGYFQGSVGVLNNAFKFREHKDDGAGVLSSSAILSDIWYHAVLVSDGGTVSWYIDGSFDTSDSLSGPRHVNSFGGDPAASESYFNGTLDEIMIFNRSLSATEVSDIYTESFARFQPQGSHDIGFPFSLFPYLVGSYTDSDGDYSLDGTRNIFVLGDYAYTTSSQDDTLAIWDISVHGNPVPVGTHTSSGVSTFFESLDGVKGVFVVDDYAYTLSSIDDSLVVWNISGSDGDFTPDFLGEYRDSSGAYSLEGAREIFILGDFAYVGAYDDDTLTVLNISNTDGNFTPTPVGYYQDSSGANSLDGVEDIFVLGNYAYTTSIIDHVFAVWDISAHGNPVPVGTYFGDGVENSTQQAPDIFVLGDYAYTVTHDLDTFVIWDISDHTDPIPIAYTPCDQCFSIDILGDYAYVGHASPSDRISVWNISNTDGNFTPDFLGEFADNEGINSLDDVLDIFVLEDYVYACASGDDTLTVLKVNDSQLSNNRLNITIQNQNQNNTNLSFSLYDGTTQSDWYNFSSNEVQTFTIDTSITQLSLNFTYIEDENAFWSPILLPDITLETYTVVGNVAPTTPILNAPLDLTYILDSDLNIPLNWSNSTDVDGDAITYYLEVWNESAMTNIMYVNASITETTNTTGDIVSFPNESSADFFWRVRAMDVTNSLNSSFSSLWNISIGYTTVEDTCDCSSIQGGTTIDCTENCDIGVCNVGGIDMTFSGAGNIYLTGDVENYADVYIYNGCNVYCTKGCFI